MRIRARMGGMRDAMGAELARVERGVTGGMRRATDGLKNELRSQVERAGLGRRLANTWRGETYPKGQTSLNPAGYVHSKAPDIITTFSSPIVIRPTGGRRYLWVPTSNVPLARGATGRIDPDELEARMRRKLVIRPSRRNPKHKVALMPDAPRTNARGKARRRAGARGMTHMYTLVPFIRGQELLAIDAAAEAWGARVPALIEQELGQ